MKRILVVDDSKIAASAAATTLEEAGYDVTVRLHPIGTGAAVMREQPDLVLLDVKLPGVSGEQIMEILLKIIPEHRMPCVLLYSDMAADELEQAARRCGANGFVTKSGGRDLLLKTVESYVSMQA